MGLLFVNEDIKSIKKGSVLTNDKIAYEQSCKVCPIRNGGQLTFKMKATGAEHSPSLYFLGEAPGEEEDRKEKQFVGRAGIFLRDAIKRVTGVDDLFLEQEIRWNNVLACRPPNNRTPTDTEITCCRSRLEEDIERTKPYIIVGFGNIPLRWVTGKDGIHNWRGRTIPVKIGKHRAWFFPLFHPSYLVRTGGTTTNEFLDRSLTRTFDLDVKRLFDFAARNRVKPKVITKGYEDNIEYIEGVNVKTELALIRKRLKQLSREHDCVHIDIETHADPNGFKPYNRSPSLLSIAVGVYEDTFVFPIEHPKAWGGNEHNYKLVLEELRKFLETKVTKAAFNLKFEMTWLLYYFGQRTLRECRWVDTMAKAVALDERPGQKGNGMFSLNMLTYLRFGFFLKEISGIKNTSFIDVPLKDLLIYNGMDTKYESLLDRSLDIELSKEKTLDWTVEHTSRLGRTLAITESNGIPIDKNMCDKLGSKYDTNIEKCITELRGLKDVVAYEKRYGTFKPSSSDDIMLLFDKVMGLPLIKTTRTGKYSTDKDVMKIFADKGIRAAMLIVDIRENSKQRSTYIDSIIDKLYSDGMIHPEYNHLFVTTGRLSAERPNIQNFPKRANVRARNIIRAPKDHVLVSIDYAQIEARMLAVMSKDKFYIDKIWNNYDVHMDWAKRVAQKNPNYVVGKKSFDEITPDLMKKIRGSIKTDMVFSLFYGARMETVAHAVGIDLAVFKPIYDDFWNTFSGVKKWQGSVLDFYNKHGYVETMMGRRRRMPLETNKILNSPVQGTASDIVTDAMNRLSDLAYELNRPWYQPIWNIHDDLSFFVPEEYLDESVHDIAKTMCVTPFEWITVPIEVEISIGKRWGKLKEVAKVNSEEFKTN